VSALWRDFLARGPILLDAGMGTRLLARGLGVGEASSWNLERPDKVLEVHQLDIAAGSDALLTNTFCAGRNWLQQFDLADRTVEINRRGVELARLASGPDRLVLGSIGPTAQGQAAPLIEQAEALVEAGIDALLLETYPRAEAEAATRLLTARFATPVVVSLFNWPHVVGETASALAAAGAAAIGVNCVESIQECLRVVHALHEATHLPLLVKPGAGRLDLFEAAVPELVTKGVRLIGGCCGTTDVHIAALRVALTRARTPV
jgi:5-methyltetrahydrofolate--homocysteine methyltransferase